jgi:hypothetical protein
MVPSHRVLLEEIFRGILDKTNAIVVFSFDREILEQV